VWWFSPLWALAEARELKAVHCTCQRPLEDVRELFEDSRSERDRLKKDIDKLKPHWQFTKELGKDSKGAVGVSVCDFFREGIEHLNQQLVSGSTSWPPAGDAMTEKKQQNGERIVTGNGINREAPIPMILASPEQASFVRDLHMTQAAATMFCSAFKNAQGRFERLSKAIQHDEKWAGQKEPQPRGAQRRLREAVDIAKWAPIMDEVVLLVKQWERKTQQWYEGINYMSPRRTKE
jgi:hypothetical protein